MSTCTHEAMTNPHVSGIWISLAAGIWASTSETLHLWRQRYRNRQELSHWTERDLHDVGVSWSDIAHEAEKPFWRA